MKNIINKIIFFILLITLQSCGVFNSVFKKSDKNKEKTEISYIKDSSVQNLDKSLIIIKEKADSIIKINTSKFNNSIYLNNIKDIKNLLLNNDLVEVKQNYDTLNKILKTDVVLKPREISIKVDKITTINKDVFTNTNVKLDSIVKTNKVIKSNIKTKEPKNSFWFTIILSGIAVGLFFGLKKIFSKKLL